MKRVLIACLALLMATLACNLPTANTLSCTSYTVTVDFEILADALNNEADLLEITEILFGVEIENFEDLEDFLSSNATPTNLPSGAYFEAIDGNGNLLILEELDEDKLQQVGEFIGAYTIFFQQSPQANPITVNIFGVVEGGLKLNLHTYVGNVNCNVHDDYQKIGQIKVTAPGTALYEAPGGAVWRNENAQEVWIPNQAAYDPYEDVYDVLNQTEVDGTQWVEIFVGNAAGTVWVPVGGPVQILSLN